MTKLEWIDLRCPRCESSFESMAVLSNDDGQQYVEPSARGTTVAVVPLLNDVEADHYYARKAARWLQRAGRAS